MQPDPDLFSEFDPHPSTITDTDFTLHSLRFGGRSA